MPIAHALIRFRDVWALLAQLQVAGLQVLKLGHNSALPRPVRQA